MRTFSAIVPLAVLGWATAVASGFDVNPQVRLTVGEGVEAWGAAGSAGSRKRIVVHGAWCAREGDVDCNEVRALLDEVAALVRAEDGPVRIAVPEGAGSPEAMAVREHLTSRGVKESRIRTGPAVSSSGTVPSAQVELVVSPLGQSPATDVVPGCGTSGRC